MTDKSLSLSTTIFGDEHQKEDKQGNENVVASSNLLTNLFDTKASSILPDKPNNLNFSETTNQRAKREKNEEKKRKRKKKGQPQSQQQEQEEEKGVEDVATTITTTTTTTTTTTASIENNGTPKKKPRKERKTPKPESTETDTNENNTTETEETTTPVEKSDEERTIFVGNLAMDVTRKQLESLFKQFGKVKSTRLRSIATTGVKVAPEHAGNQKLVKKISVNTKQFLPNAPKNTIQGYVVYENIESVQTAIQYNNQPLPNSNLILRIDTAKPTMDSTRSVFVGNLPYKAKESTLREHFMKGCDITEENAIEGVRIVRDKETSECKGFGYVLFVDKSYVPDALKMHGSTYMKKELRVLVCGKRFKGRKGAPKEERIINNGAHKRIVNAGLSSTKKLVLGVKDKKKRGIKKIGVNKAAGNNTSGISKRSKSDKKLKLRVKKIEKRLTKGMGKTKK